MDDTFLAQKVCPFSVLKTECFGPLLVPMRLADTREQLVDYVAWYNEYRPHQGLMGKTPAEMASGTECFHPRFETRGKHGVKLRLVVSHFRDRRHLPVVELQQAA